MAILLPKKTAHRKVRKGKNEGIATRCNTVAFGDFGLMSLDNERITSRQIEAARQAITRYIKRGVLAGFDGLFYGADDPSCDGTNRCLGRYKPQFVLFHFDF